MFAAIAFLGLAVCFVYVCNQRNRLADELETLRDRPAPIVRVEEIPDANCSVYQTFRPGKIRLFFEGCSWVLEDDKAKPDEV